MSPVDFELRVLSGLHRDARCLAQDGAVLGADPACDIVLADDGLEARAARLRIGSQGWDLMPGEESAALGHEPATPFNQPMPLGPVWVTIARAADPWIPLPVAANDAISAAPDALADAPATAVMPPAGQSGLPAKSPRKRDTWPMMLGLGAIILAIAVALIMAWLPDSRRARPPLDPRAAAERSLGPISAAIERLGLASRLHVTLSPAGTVIVEGWVRNAAEQDRLAAALSQIWPMPAMRVTNEAAVLDTARSALKLFGVKYEPRYDGNGRLTILGVATNARERVAALDAVRAQVPGLTVLGGAIQLAAQVADDLATRLAQADLSGVTLSWRAQRLEADPAGLDDDQLARLQAVLADFNQTHVDIAAVASGPRQYADSVPFEIRSIVSGPQPFVVLGDGSKLLVGGTYQRYRLTDVEPTRIIFDGPRPAIVIR